MTLAAEDDRRLEAPSAPEPAGYVAIGASAGGLEAIQRLLATMPRDFPWAVLITTHMAPDQPSQLTEILARSSPLPVREAVRGDTPRAGEILVGRPDAEMILGPDDRIAFQPATRGPPRRVDALFGSLTRHAPRVIAIVLSGTGSDGASGAGEIRRAGGRVIAESEATAKNFGMPAAAIQAGAVDHVVDVSGIAPLLSRLVTEAPPAPAPPEEDVSEVLALLRERRRTDFEQYRSPMVHRRVRKRMAHLGIDDAAKYAAYARSSPEELDALFDSLLINVTEFFRDADAWRAFEETVVPSLAARARGGEEVRIWSCGCASGQEVYSVAMLFAEALPDPADLARVKIFATDLDAAALAEARSGRYSAKQTASVPPERLARFFTPAGDGHEVIKPLRRLVIFGLHDLSKDPPIGKIDAVLCRNVLIYLEPKLQRRVFRLFEYALNPNGYLFLGRSEELPRGVEGFAILDRRNRLYRREAAAARASFDPALAKGPAGARRRGNEARPPQPTTSRDLADVLLDASDIVVLAVDSAGRVRSANPYARHILSLETGSFEGRSVAEIVPQTDGAKLRDAVSACCAAKHGRKLGTITVDVKRGRPANLSVTLEPYTDAEGATLALVLGHDITDLEEARTTLAGRNRDLFEAVHELQRANEDLQRTNEDLVTANEELQSTNEELSTLTEEVQSTNEELETTNEELQSTNEELGAVNAELQRTSVEASSLTAQLRSLLQISSEAIVICDPQQRVTFFNRRAQEFFGLDARDVIGRNIHALDLRLEPGLVRELLDKVTSTEERQEPRTTAVRGRAAPERWVSFVADTAREEGTSTETGWILAFRDITPEIQQAAEARRLRARHDAWLKAACPAVLFLLPDGRIEAGTKDAERLLGEVFVPGETWLWDIAADHAVGLQLRGALASHLARGDGETEGLSSHLNVRLRSGASVVVEFTPVDARGEPPLVLLSQP